MLISFWANKLVFEVHLPKFSMLLFVAVVITVWHTCTCSLCHYLLQLNRNEKKSICVICVFYRTQVYAVPVFWWKSFLTYHWQVLMQLCTHTSDPYCCWKVTSCTVFTISTNSPLLTASSSSAFYRLSCTLFTEQIFIISAQYTTTHLTTLYPFWLGWPVTWYQKHAFTHTCLCGYYKHLWLCPFPIVHSICLA